MRPALLVMFVAAGCGTTEVHEVLLRAPAAQRKEVPVYVVAQPLGRAMEDAAIVQVFASGEDAAPRRVLESLGSRGLDLGCDAVVRARVDQGATMTVASGVCVRWAKAALP
jgi:hypothetical protein